MVIIVIYPVSDLHSNVVTGPKSRDKAGQYKKLN